MAMQKRVGFTLTEAQIEQACEAFVAARLLPDEEAKAMLCQEEGRQWCDITVSKKRVRRAKKESA